MIVHALLFLTLCYALLCFVMLCYDVAQDSPPAHSGCICVSLSRGHRRSQAQQTATPGPRQDELNTALAMLLAMLQLSFNTIVTVIRCYKYASDPALPKAHLVSWSKKSQNGDNKNLKNDEAAHHYPSQYSCLSILSQRHKEYQACSWHVSWHAKWLAWEGEIRTHERCHQLEGSPVHVGHSALPGSSPVPKGWKKMKKNLKV